MGYDTSIRDEAVRRQAEHREALRKRALEATRAALSELAGEAGIEEAYIFGSVVRPKAFREQSDVDIAVAGALPRGPIDLAAKVSRMINREVHVVELDGSRVAERARAEGIVWKPAS